MQSDVQGRPDTRDLIRAYEARFGDRPVPEGDDALREALGWDEMMNRLNRDERMSVVPDNFLLYESADERVERIRRTSAGLAELLRGDLEEHRKKLGDSRSCACRDTLI